MGFRQVSSAQRVITETLANEYATMQTIPHDRPLSPRRVEIYEKVYNNNLFRGPEWAKVVCKENGNTYRVNGKHTSTLFSKIKNTFGVKATIQTFEADTFEDVIRLYSTFDNKTQSRSAGDINTAFIASVVELRDIPRKLGNDTIAGINYVMYGDTSRKMQPSERAEKILDPKNVKFLVWLHNNLYLDNSPRNHIWRSPVVAAIYSSYNKSQTDALTFWREVRDESGTSPDMPSRRLAKFLVAEPFTGNMAMREWYTKSLLAWNAFRSNKTTDLKYYKNCKPVKAL